MKIADFFRKPICTYCNVQGVETEIMAEVDYQPAEPRVNVFEQAEVVEVRNLRGVSIMDSMYMVELEELEDRLLAMAKSAHESRKDDAREFAREIQNETLGLGVAQRRIGA